MSTPFSRRSLFGYAGAGVATAALAACSGPSTTTAGSATTAPSTDWSKVTPATSISWLSSHPGQSEAAEKEIVAAFKAAHNIDVNLITGGKNYEEVAAKFQTQQAGTDVSDVVVASDVWWFRLAINDQIIPLTDDLLKAVDNDVSEYQTTLFNDYVSKDQHWAVPFARSTPLFYYNKDHFAAAGLPDRAPTTWDEFEGWTAALQKANAGQPGYLHPYQYPALDGYAGWTLQNTLWGRGGGWSDEWTITCADAPAVEALQWVQDSIVTKGWAGVSSKDAIADLTSGAVSATISSTGDLVGALKSAAGANRKLGVGFLPGGPKATTQVCPTGGSGLVIAKKTSPERQLASAMFISFATNAENSALFSKATGYMPVRTTADMASVLAATPQIQVAYDQLKATRSQDYARVFLPGADAEMAKTAAKIMNEKADPQTALTALKTTLETIYNRDVKPKLG